MYQLQFIKMTNFSRWSLVFITTLATPPAPQPTDSPLEFNYTTAPSKSQYVTHCLDILIFTRLYKNDLHIFR